MGSNKLSSQNYNSLQFPTSTLQTVYLLHYQQLTSTNLTYSSYSWHTLAHIGVHWRALACTGIHGHILYPLQCEHMVTVRHDKTQAHISYTVCNSIRLHVLHTPTCTAYRPQATDMGGGYAWGSHCRYG